MSRSRREEPKISETTEQDNLASDENENFEKSKNDCKGEKTRWTNLGTVIGLALFAVYYASIGNQDKKIIVEMKKYSDIISDTNPGNRQFMASVEDHISGIKFHEVKCHDNGYWREADRHSAPQKCGTILSDTVVTEQEAQTLRALTARILDTIGYQSVNYEESTNIKRIRLYELFVWGPQRKVFNENEFDLINKTAENVKRTIADSFGIPIEQLFFAPVSEMTRFKPITEFKEFRHIDKVRSAPLVVTSIIWLSTVGKDFEGGRVEFLTGGPEPFSPLLIEPKLGRFGAWTSGYENPHGVLELESGERLALLFAMTTDSEIGHKTMTDLKEHFLKEQSS